MPKVSDLFTLTYGHSLELNALAKSSDSLAINFVGRAARNNGVTARVSPVIGLDPAPCGTLTVALGGQGGAGVAFLQPSPYYCGRDVMILTAKEPMSEHEKLWWATCISANRFRFGFGRQANRTLKDLRLPDGIPAWVGSTDCGTSFVQELTRLARSSETAELNVGPHDAIGGSRCDVSALFHVEYGTNLELLRLERSADGINFVSRTARNNGVTARIVALTDLEPSPGRALSVAAGGSVLETFVQFEPFYSGRDIYVLRPKNFMSDEVLMFYASCIRANQWKYSYGRQANRTLRGIQIPTPDAIPRWVHGSFARVASSLLPHLSDL